MNKLITLILALTLIVTGAFAQDKLSIRPYNWTDPHQVRSQSLTVTPASSSISALWLRDGLSNDYAALSYPLYQVLGLGNRVNIVGLGSYEFNNTTDTKSTNVYLGTGLSFDVINTGGWKLSVLGGYKGLDLTTLANTTATWKSAVVGLNVTVPIR